MELTPKGISSQYQRYYHALEPTIRKPKTRSYSTVIFFFLVVALFGWYAIKPTIQTILYLQREIKDKTTLNETMDKKINNLIDAQAAYENAGPKLPLITQAVPDMSEAVKISSQIQQLASEQHASLSAIQISAVPLTPQQATPSGAATSTQAVKKLQQYPVSVTVEGSFPEIKNFIMAMLSLRRLVTIESVTMSSVKKPVSGGGSTQTVHAAMRITAFYNQL